MRLTCGSVPLSITLGYVLSSVIQALPSPSPTGDLKIKIPSISHPEFNTTGLARVLGPPDLSATLPPTGFTIDASMGFVSLDDKGCLLLTIDTLGRLAKSLYNTPRLRPEVSRLRSVPNIALRMTGQRPADAFDTRFMVWGLTLAIRYMVDRNDFRNGLFTLRWRGAFVGSASFVHVNSGQNVIEGNETSWMTDLSQPSFNDTMIHPSSLERRNPAVKFNIENLPGPNLVLHDVMMVIVGGMTDLAGHDFRQTVRGGHFETIFSPYRGRLEFSPVVPPPAAAPDWFTYDFLRTALGVLALRYLSQEVCKPVQMIVLRDGLFSGYGTLVDSRAGVAVSEK